MAAPTGSILPESYFDGLSALWGGCAYVGSSIVVAGLIFHGVRGRPDVSGLIWLLAKVFLVGLCTAFLREWLMRVNDLVISFGVAMGADPRAVDEKFIQFIAGKTAASPDSSVWDVIWGTKSLGTAICYAFLWLFGWFSWGVQYIVKLVGGVLLTAGWALSPLFLSFFMLRPMVGIAQKYVVGLVALVCWPFGFVIAAVVTNAMLEAAASANLMPIVVAGAPLAAPALTVLLVGSWMVISSVLAPIVTSRIFLMGANPAVALAESAFGVAQAAFGGGMASAVAASTAGVGTAGILASGALGSAASGAESSIRGGGPAQTTATAVRGISGFYSGTFMRRHAAAAETSADAQRHRANATEMLAAEVSTQLRRGKSRSGFDAQPHEADPNAAAIDVESNDKSKP